MLSSHPRTVESQEPATRAATPQMETGRSVPTQGSPEEMAATARVVGYPGAGLTTCTQIERLIRQQLLWES